MLLTVPSWGTHSFLEFLSNYPGERTSNSSPHKYPLHTADEDQASHMQPEAWFSENWVHWMVKPPSHPPVILKRHSTSLLTAHSQVSPRAATACHLQILLLPASCMAGLPEMKHTTDPLKWRGSPVLYHHVINPPWLSPLKNVQNSLSNGLDNPFPTKVETVIIVAET